MKDALINAKVGYEADNWNIYLYGKNIFDEDYTWDGVGGYWELYSDPRETKKDCDYIRDYGMEDRITTTGGDYTRDDLGSCYDLILAGGTLNFFKEFLEPIMAKIYKALSPGGIFISLHDVLTPDGTGPGVSVRRFLPMDLAGEDFYLEAGRFANTMARAGLQPIGSRSVETPMGPLDHRLTPQ